MIIFNFLPIASGGALQNALSFLETLRGYPEIAEQCVAVLPGKSKLHDACRSIPLEHIEIGEGRAARLAFELSCRQVFRRGQTCFTLFGPPMIWSGGYMINVNGCAYSNLFYPEIPFWNHLSLIPRSVKELIDIYRRSVTSIADYWIFETEILARRAVELCGFPAERVGVVEMAPSALVTPNNVIPERKTEYSSRISSKKFKILLLCGAHPNKRLHLLPPIADELRRCNAPDFSFVLTVPPDVPYTRSVLGDFAARKLSQHVYNIGTVRSEHCASLIDTCNALAIFSRLESFSNNFVEAWRMDRPLVATDADWARAACGDGAVYVNPVDARATAAVLAKLMTDHNLRKRLTERGRAKLAYYNTPNMKLEDYLRHIEKAHHLGLLSKRERSVIRWPSRRERQRAIDVTLDGRGR